MHLYIRLFDMKMPNDGNVETQITEMLTTIRKLAAMVEGLKENLQAALLIHSMPESYDVLTSTLRCQNERDFTMEYVRGRLLDEYFRRNDVRDSESSRGANYRKIKELRKMKIRMLSLQRIRPL